MWPLRSLKVRNPFLTLPDLVTWPLVTWGWNFYTRCLIQLWGGSEKMAALLGLWIFHHLMGGVFEPPPPRLSRLLRVLERNGKLCSKACERSFRNHIGHFLAQVKIEVTRGQNFKIFQNGFWTIKSLTRDLMGGPPPVGFSPITHIRLGIALWNFQYLSGHQFYASSEKFCPRSPKVKSYRGQTEVLFGRFCQKSCFR